MLLTLNPTSQNGIQRPNEYSRFRQSIFTPRSPSPSTPDPLPSTAPSRPPDPSMDSRSGLPRPSLTLPPPDVGFANMPSSTTNQQLPPPPSQWQGSDDAMHHWLRAKAEEDRRKQEEEKTRQETLRLEQRRVEQSMLRDSLMAGVPPHIIPLIFAGICQNGLPQPVLELAQQYLAQAPGPRGPSSNAPQAPSHSHSQSNSHSRRPSMHVRQDSRSGPPSSYAPSTQHVVPPPPPPNILLSQNAPPNISAPSTPQAVGRRSLPTSLQESRGANPPWINHGIGGQAQPGQVNLGSVQYAPGSSVPGAQPPRRPGSQSRRSPPSLYFHHWVPPAQSQSGGATGKAQQESSASSGNPRRSEHYVSPGRKRKAPGPHQPPPVPSRPTEPFPGALHLSQPISPRSEGPQSRPLGHRHQPSEPTNAYGGHHIDSFRVEQPGRMGSTQPLQHPSGYTPSMGKGHDAADQKRSEDSSPVDGIGRSFPPVHHGPYAVSGNTGNRDSDLDGSSHQSPTSEAPVTSNQLRDAGGD
ncbi:uncharacterized protein BDV14DRAFT_178453 [Aspergillus stella-maris]|uniref:uncharacterized protein n=1 Tax=Aspergillus stella-maris TaxID=1810926 RepID=UPI003CCD8EC4